MTWTDVAAVVVGVLASARLTRLLVHDDWPPVLWLRSWYGRHANDAWYVLVECHYCMAPWVTAGVLAAALLSDTATWWWVGAGWLAGSYVAAMVVSWDGSD